MTSHTLTDQAAEIAAAGRLLSTARRILFITGAGLSADSGLPTYRGVGGLYEGTLTDIGLPIEQALSGAMFAQRPDIAWRYLSQIESSCRGAHPNAGHYAIARLEALRGDVTVLTQNVDGFHLAAGSRDVIEMHGTLRRLRCVDCGRARQVDNYAGLTIPPECPHCGGIIRPDVVLFGEQLPDQAVHRFEQVLAAGPDLIVSVGTGSAPAVRPGLKPDDMWLLDAAKTVPGALMNAAAAGWDMACRVLGECRFGRPIDQEVGDLVGSDTFSGAQQFAYVRYDPDVTREGLDALGLWEVDPAQVQRLDSVAHIPTLQKVGQAYAGQVVKPEHLRGFLPAAAPA